MWGTVAMKGSILEKFTAVKNAGFAGVEATSHPDREEIFAAAKATGLKVPSVCCDTHWAHNLASPDAEERKRGFDGLTLALQDAKKFGASSVLFVPCSVNENVSYGDAYLRSQEELRKALPIAEECGVKIAIENVWNNFLLSPLEMARYIDEFKSPWIGSHFDVGNVLRYGWPEQWIPVLGKRIQKFHIKEFSRKKMQNAGLAKGFDVNLLEGDNDWPAVMKAVDGIGYDGWFIAEQRGADSPEGLKKISDAMDKILAS
ncbi:MAG: Xylose isomerase domain protein barrel [Verrucomicrobiales bacterium]|nr:Xylose isomerase domain protein barrel [Verrucomicrobiales bacterium]